jgi:hypothetical protein
VLREGVHILIAIVAFLIQINVSSAQGIYISEGANVKQEGGAISLKNNLYNEGNVVTNGGTIYFSGTTQSINGSVPIAYNDLRISTGSTTTVASTGSTIKSILKSDGTLNTDGNLRLLSTPSRTALIDGSGTGNVIGNVTMQRYLDTAYGYKYFSAPFQSATVNEFADEVDLNAAFPPVYRFDENSTSTGWYYYINPVSLLNPVEGYALHFGNGTSSKTISLTGQVNNGTQSLNVYNNNRTYTEGFTLVGNPYPSPIDWDAATGWTRTNVDNAVYFFKAGNADQYSGTYCSYINGVSSDGKASNIIPAMQGFFIHVSNGSYPVAGTFAMNNSVRVNNLNPTFFKRAPFEYPMIRLAAKLNNKAADPMVIYLNEKATDKHDIEQDALKMLNTDKEVPNLYAVSADGFKQSIYSINDNIDSFVQVPLTLEISTDGNVEFYKAEAMNMPDGLRYYLLDMNNKSAHDLSEKYSLQLKAGKYIDRFSLVFSRKEIPVQLLTSTELNAFFKNGRIYVYLSQATGEKGALLISSASGQVIFRQEISGLGYKEFEAPAASGIYIVSFLSDKGVFSKKLFVEGR